MVMTELVSQEDKSLPKFDDSLNIYCIFSMEPVFHDDTSLPKLDDPLNISCMF